MVEQRPFRDLAEVLDKAAEIWWSLSDDDWLEAYRSHPKIGEKKAEQAQAAEAQAWSRQEQSGTSDSAPEIMAALAEGNEEYLRRFGFIFIICATGKSAEEILARLRERIAHAPVDELRIAAAEQNQITQLRLRKLVSGQ